MLGLEGKSMSIAITKTVGIEEDLRTKLFKFQVTALDIEGYRNTPHQRRCSRHKDEIITEF